MSICPAGRTEAANDSTTSKSNSDAIGKLILKTAARKVRVLSMVNDDSYWSVSGDSSAHLRCKPSNVKRTAGATAALSELLRPKGEGEVEVSFGLQLGHSNGKYLTPAYLKEIF
jgi:hypothetical protein